MRYLENENPFIICRFTTGDTVTIDIYDLSDDSKDVDGASMTEIGSTGYFKYLFNPDVSALKEYIYIADNSIEEHAGKIILGGFPDGIKDQTDKMHFTGDDIKATLDGEEVTTDSASRTASKATGFATSTALTSHDTKLDTVDGIVDRILIATEIKQGSVNDASASTTKFITDLSESDNNFWVRAAILFTSGDNQGQIRGIKNYLGSTKEVTLQTPLNSAPANNDTFIICVGRKFLTPDVTELADAMWDEQTSGHTDSGSFGESITKILQIEKGRWKIENNTMIFYDSDDLTPLLTFNLKNKEGTATETEVFERTPA